MEKELKKAFHRVKYGEKPDLAENIWEGIVRYNKRIARIKLWVFSFIGLLSLAGLIPAWKALSSDLAQSGFYEYLSLAFSNGNSILPFWKELSFSLAESVPIMSTIISLSLIFIFFLSLKSASKQIIRGQLSLSF